MADVKRAIPDAHHEIRDISEGFIWGAVALLLASLIAIALLVLWLFPQSLEDRTIQGSLPSYPEPHLQPSPRADMQAFHSEELKRLNSAGWVDQAKGIVHIPITDAMSAVAREGIAGWPTATARSP